MDLLMPLTAAAVAEAHVAERKRYMGEGWWGLWHELGWPARDQGGGEESTRLNWEKLAQLTRLAEFVVKSGVEGDYAEFGVWRGGALCFVATALARAGSSARVLGFDSFAGLPKGVGRDGDKLWEGQFSDTSVARVRGLFERHGLAGRLELYQGWFEETIGAVEGRAFAMVHVDCDLYEPQKLVLERVWERLSVGGVMVFDDYRCPDTPGITIAVEEFFAGRAEVVRVTPGLESSGWVVKGG